MLAAHIDAILADFTRRRIPFSHRDVADRVPDLLPGQLDEVRRLVFEKMVNVPAYHLSLARFVGEGLTLLCIPREIAPGPSTQIETPAFESGRLVG
jgi:hypothetical protein